MATENPYFKVLEREIIRPENIKAKVVASSRDVPQELQSLLDEKWEKDVRKKRPDDEALSRFRYEGCEIADGVLTLKVSPTISYKDYLTWEPGFSEKYGSESAPLPLAATTLIVTSDGKVVMTRRGVSHDYKRQGLSGIGGFFEIIKDSRSDGAPDILRALGREVEEEAGIEIHELNPLLYGVIHNPVSGSVGLSFISTTHLSSNDIEKRRHDEENELIFVDLTPEAIQNLVLTKTNVFTTEVLELLMILGEEKFGKKWAEETREIFSLRGISYAEALRRGPKTVAKLERRDIRKE